MITFVRRAVKGSRSASLRESHLHVGTLFEVDAFDEPNLTCAHRHNHRRSSCAFSEEAHAFHQRAVGHTGGSKDELLSRRKIFRFVNPILVLNSHALQPLFLFRLYYQAAEHVSVQAADSRRSDNALWRAAGSHDR